MNLTFSENLQYLLGPENLVKIAPYAEDYDVKVGVEIHNPDTPSTPMIQSYYDAIVASGSKHIGFVTDFGCFANKPNYESYERALEQGANKEVLDFAVKLRYDEVPMEEAQKKLEEMNADAQVMRSFFNNYGFLTYHKNPDYEGLKRIMPYCFHFHSKFHRLMSDGSEHSIAYDKILPIIRDSGYDGYIVSEYEGHILSDDSAFEMTKKQIELKRRILQQ